MARKKTLHTGQQANSAQIRDSTEAQNEYKRQFGELMELGRKRMEELLQRRVVITSHEPILWLSLAEAERLTGINRGTLSKAIKKGELVSNGATGKGRVKVSAAAFLRWLSEQTKKPDRQESDAQVEKLMKKFCNG
jgi:hypothetical protein